MKKIFILFRTLAVVFFFGSLFFSCSGNVNAVFDSHFTEDGYLIKDSANAVPAFTVQDPTNLKVYVEVSGSMNGFFRANQPTQFKTDVWRILSYYSQLIPEVNVLTNDGNQGMSIALPKFQTMMNTGAFVSTASTKVPLMLKTILDDLAENPEGVAVLISDMKYSPVGSAAPKVLLTQYSSDISKLFGEAKQAVSLIGATSEYLDKKGNVVYDNSPYYFLVLGNQEKVASVRNCISTYLEDSGHFIDNIETGFKFGSPTHSFGTSFMCDQIEDEPTFTSYEEHADGDTCSIKLKVNLENYRWILTDENVFNEALQVETTYGSSVKTKLVSMDVMNITNQKLDRKVVATVELKLYNMPLEAEVIKWTLKLPDLNISRFGAYLGGDNEDDVTKSYSVDNFIVGMFQGGVVNKEMDYNYILVSKNY